MFRDLLGPLFKGRGTEDYYRERAGEAADSFRNEPPPLPPFAEPYEDDIPFAEEVFDEPRIEVVDFAGASTDIQWMTFNHDTGEVIIRFLEHGEITKHAHAYSYTGVPYEEFLALAEGKGPFPGDRSPYYTKPVSVGQRANFYLRNDQQDDLYDYKREKE